MVFIIIKNMQFKKIQFRNDIYARKTVSVIGKNATTWDEFATCSTKMHYIFLAKSIQLSSSLINLTRLAKIPLFLYNISV